MRNVFIREEEIIVKAEKYFKANKILLDIINSAIIFKEAHKFICQPMRESLDMLKYVTSTAKYIKFIIYQLIELFVLYLSSDHLNDQFNSSHQKIIPPVNKINTANISSTNFLASFYGQFADGMMQKHSYIKGK